MVSYVRSVSQAFSILRLLAPGQALSLSEIARSLELSPSSALNLLRTLVDEGAVNRGGENKRYRISQDWAEVDLFQLGKAQCVMDRLRAVMERFAKQHAATVALWKTVPGRRLSLLAHAQCNAPVRIQITDGQRQPLGAGAAGRALAASEQADTQELARRFGEVRWQKEMTLQKYIEEVHLASERGFAIDDGLAFAGICTVAVALRNPMPGYCISASVFSGSRIEGQVAALGTALAQLGADTERKGLISVG